MARKAAHMEPEKLTIKDLGPIAKLSLSPRALTVIAGEQATGKSLVAQLLYLFRGLQGHLANRFKPGLRSQKAWKAELLKGLLDDLRSVPFGYFANVRAQIAYRPVTAETEWTVSLHEGNRRVSPGRNLGAEMERWVAAWERSPEKLTGTGRPQIFVPTERSVFTRFIQQQPKVLFSDFQPLPVREFANTLQAALELYVQVKAERSPLRKLQLQALKGTAYVPKRGPRLWKWKTSNGKKSKILPIEAVASGQMEAWPFFAVAEANLHQGLRADYYLEEPETHLHPRAQVAVMDAVALLVAQGNRVVLTTHSPYMLYRLNILLQRSLVEQAGKDHRRAAPVLAPDHVCALRLGNPPEDILDRRGTGLVDVDELEQVADELGGEFELLLDQEEST